METVATMGWKMTWSERVEAWAEEGEAWVVISQAHPSPTSPQLGQAG